MKELITRLQVRSVIVLLLVFGTLILAINDKNFRPTFGDLAKIGVGGYLAQIIPGGSKRE